MNVIRRVENDAGGSDEEDGEDEYTMSPEDIEKMFKNQYYRDKSRK